MDLGTDSCSRLIGGRSGARPAAGSCSSRASPPALRLSRSSLRSSRTDQPRSSGVLARFSAHVATRVREWCCFGNPRHPPLEEHIMNTRPKRLRVGLAVVATTVGAGLGGAAIAGAATSASTSAAGVIVFDVRNVDRDEGRAGSRDAEARTGRDAAYRHDRREGQSRGPRGGAGRHDHPGRDRLGGLALRSAHDQVRRHPGHGQGRRELQGHHNRGRLRRRTRWRRPGRRHAHGAPGGSAPTGDLRVRSSR